MEKGFWAVPKSIAKKNDLSFRAKLIAGILWTRKNSDFQAFPSWRYMAEVLSVSTDTVDRGIKELKEKAGLRVKREGLRRNNRYLLPDWNSESAEWQEPDSARESNQDSAKQPIPIVRDNKKDITVVDEQSSSVKDIISFYKTKVKEIKGYIPEISWAKEGQLVKQRLQKYSSNQIKELVNWYLHSKHAERLGDSLAVCLSTNIINLWKASRVSHDFYLDKLYPPIEL